MKKEKEQNWKSNEIDNLIMEHLFMMFKCTTKDAVNVTVNYAKFMATINVTPDNYPVFFRLLQSGNHWVIDALLNKKEPEDLFTVVQPTNTYILTECIKILNNGKPGGIYPNLLRIILQLIKLCFEDPNLGYNLYPLSTNEINSIGKHLNEEESHDSPVNGKILHLLDRIASLNTPGLLPPRTKEIESIATQANSIRGKFLDPLKNLSEAIPRELLSKGDYTKTEIAPG